MEADGRYGAFNGHPGCSTVIHPNIDGKKGTRRRRITQFILRKGKLLPAFYRIGELIAMCTESAAAGGVELLAEAEDVALLKAQGSVKVYDRAV